MNKQEKNTSWYNDPTIISWVLIGIIAVIILSSQSFSAVVEVSALKMVQNILNHNITYMIMLVYFVALHTKFGKKYFDYANVLMIVFLAIVFVTSVLTMLQSFSLVSLLVMANDFLIFIYFFHTFLRGTRFWREFKLNKSLFTELSNDWFFNAIVVIEVSLYAVSLISMTTVDGTFLATFDCVYVVLFARYIYLYGMYLDSIGKNSVEKVVENVPKSIDSANSLETKTEDVIVNFKEESNNSKENETKKE